ncbi:hypothetical protein V1517DRAFT_327274 [Lipomyces orientalis]|uniref:Uncharacterized protein n=1 Tax=Lipomyces orientalis TaxID=1233043 RepID=A0ACC3TKD7_9ASCO
MSFTSPTARPFSPRHRPPPIQVQQSQVPDQRDAAVSFARSPAARASLLSNIRTRNENVGHPRTPYPPGYSTPKKQQYAGSPYVSSVNNSSPSSSDEDVRGDTAGEEKLDPRVYAALHAKQQELLATSMYIAQQQQRIQLAMMNAAQQQLQQQHHQQQQPQYVQDHDGNVWFMPNGEAHAYSGVYGNYVTQSQHASPRTGSPASMTNMYGAEYSGVQTQEFYSVGNDSTASLNSSNGKSGKRQAHKKSSSLSSVPYTPQGQLGPAKKSASPIPSSTQFDEYRVEIGSRASTPSSDMSANGNSNPYAPIRQPIVPITLEELKKPVNSELNFWSVGLARLNTSTEGRTERGKVVIKGSWEKNWIGEDLKTLWGSVEDGVNGISEVTMGVSELGVKS